LNSARPIAKDVAQDAAIKQLTVSGLPLDPVGQATATASRGSRKVIRGGSYFRFSAQGREGLSFPTLRCGFKGMAAPSETY